MGVKTYWVEPTREIAVGLRRYTHGQTGADVVWGCDTGHHDALIYTGRAQATFNDKGYREMWRGAPPHDDPAWPRLCRRCDYAFGPTDEWQGWSELIYEHKLDDGTAREYVLHQSPHCSADAVGASTAPPGASWDAWWYRRKGPDGICMAVLLPNGHTWLVDSEASNCTKPGEDHYCWIRTGDPKLGNVTAGKEGDTCAAGAGSIQSGDYHGFLVGGEFT